MIKNQHRHTHRHTNTRAHAHQLLNAVPICFISSHIYCILFMLTTYLAHQSAIVPTDPTTLWIAKAIAMSTRYHRYSQRSIDHNSQNRRHRRTHTARHSNRTVHGVNKDALRTMKNDTIQVRKPEDLWHLNSPQYEIDISEIFACKHYRNEWIDWNNLFSN